MQPRRRRPPLREQPKQEPPAGTDMPWWGLAGALVLVVAALLLFAWLRPAPAPDTVVITLGAVENAVGADALVARRERLFTAPVSGQVRRLAPEGERVRVGTPIVALSPPGTTASVEVRTDMAGLLAYQTDGLEDLLGEAERAGWNPAWFRSLALPGPRPTAESEATEGAPLFKVVDNISQGLLVAIDASGVPTLQKGSDIGLGFPWSPGRRVAARVERLERDGTAALLYLTASLWPEALAGVRRVRLNLVFDSLAGKIVPRSAMDVRGGLQGVWVSEAGRLYFQPVRVIGGNAASVVLETGLEPGTRILRTAPLHMD